MNDELWNQWVADWHWITDAMRRHGCESTTPVISPPASKNIITTIEQSQDIRLPHDFIQVVTTYSETVSLGWRSVRRDRNGDDSDWKNFPRPLSGVFSGAGSYLWCVADYEAMLAEFRVLQNNVFPAEPTEFFADVWDDEMAEYNAICHQKLPLLETPNGDFVAFDLRHGDDDARPLVYLSHDGASTHGMRLAENFVEFMTVWSRLGCPGPEEWQLSGFYDTTSDRLKADEEPGRRWREIVNEPEPWFPGTV